MQEADGSSGRRRIDLHHPGLNYLFSTAGGSTGSLTRDVAIKLARVYQRDRWRVSPRRLGQRVDRIPLDRPIFLLGTQGASETIIGRALRRNRAVVSVSGNSEAWTGADEMGTLRNRMARLPESLWGSKHRSDLEHPLIATDQPYACDDLLHAYRRTGRDATPGDAKRLARLLREHIAVYAHDAGGARFLDKTHAYTVKVSFLAALLEAANPCFCLVIRNPFETCRWMVERKPTLFRPGVPPHRRLELVAEHWSNAYATALADAESVPRVAVVRFEDFLADPDEVVRALCEFVQLEFHPAMVPAPGQTRPFATLPGDRKWYPLYRRDLLEGMTAREQSVIARRCGELAERFGYSAAGTSAASEPIQVLGRRRERHLADVPLVTSSR